MKIIHHVLDVAAPPQRVWFALTEADGLGGWWSPSVTVQGREVGAELRFTFDSDFNPVMQVAEVEEGQRLVWHCTEGHSNWKDNTFIFEVAGLPDGRTRLRFTQDYAVELSDDDFGIYNFNWGYYLESLRLLCVTGAGKPYLPGRTAPRS